MDCCHDKHIKILFIRHGFSCANARQYHQGKDRWGPAGWLARKGKALMNDPQLTNYGIMNIETAAQPFLEEQKVQPDIVLSSTLLRAIQTAHFLFPKEKVYVAPYIRESGPGFDNIADRPQAQMNNFVAGQKQYNAFVKHYNKKARRKLRTVHVDWNRFGDNTPVPVSYRFVNGGVGQVTWKEAQKVDYDKFIMDFIEKKIIPMLVFGGPQKKTYLIAVVGHSYFMRENIKTEILAAKKAGRIEKSRFKHLNNPDNVAMIDLNFCLKANPSLKGSRYNPREWELQPVGANCGCKPLRTLRDHPIVKSKFCNGVFFTGFNIPNRNIYEKIGGGKNCKKGLLY
jgi:broad specificity phosphatase PhoE